MRARTNIKNAHTRILFVMFRTATYTFWKKASEKQNFKKVKGKDLMKNVFISKTNQK